MLFAQADDIMVTTTTTNADAEALGMLGMIILLAMLPFLVLLIASYWKMFTKAGEDGWKSIIPVYNTWVLAEISGRPGWWALIILLASIPIINFVAAIPALVLWVLISIDLAKSFGKDPVFSIVLLLVPFVGYPMLAFGKAQYVGPGGAAGQNPQFAGPQPQQPGAPVTPPGVAQPQQPMQNQTVQPQQPGAPVQPQQPTAPQQPPQNQAPAQNPNNNQQPPQQ